MYILGLSCYAHDATCSLVKDGEIRSVIEEERLNRQKHTWRFPIQAIEKSFSMEGITIHDIDEITFFWTPGREIVGNMCHAFKYFPASLNLFRAPSGGEELSFLKRLGAMRHVGEEFKKHFNLTKTPKVRFVEHHLCHAASVYFVSPFPEAAILTIDGRGESTSTMMSVGK